MKIAVQYGLAWPEIPDVYEVSFNGCQIGRLWLARDGGKPGKPWEWLINLPMSLPDTTKGSAATLEAALEAFARQWGRLVAHVATDRLQRALDLARDVERKHQPAGQRDTEIWRGVVEHVVELTADDLADPADAGAVRSPANAAQLPEKAATAAPPAPAETVAIAPAPSTPKQTAPAAAQVVASAAVRTVVASSAPRQRVIQVKAGPKAVVKRGVVSGPPKPVPAAATVQPRASAPRSSGEIAADMSAALEGDAPTPPR